MIICRADAEIGHTDTSVTLRVPVSGRQRTLHFDPLDAIAIANWIATHALRITPARAPGAVEPLEIALQPYAAGQAHLRIETVHGPFVFALGPPALNALATAATAALEFAEPGGKA
ncbi:MAG: hypothetical protein CMN73_04220 [Sphingomonas sp.]|nr:hypothetical protein [Sphingomonas sp.]